MLKAIRHGDVLLIPLKAIPSDTALKALPKPVLALGEVTGHSHRMEGAAVLYEAEVFVDPVFDLEVTRVLRVAEESLLRHEEHHTLTVPPGDYAVIPQRDYVPSGWAFVRD